MVSTLSLAACGLYVLVVLACARAAACARQGAPPRWHFPSWVLVALLYVVLIALRLSAFEDLFRDIMRETLREHASFDSRQGIQRPLAAIIVAAAAAMAFWLVRLFSRLRHSRRNVAAFVAIVSGLGMVFLMAMRLLSLHDIDWLLYGPLKLNWFADIGLSFLVIAMAARYTTLTRARNRNG